MLVYIYSWPSICIYITISHNAESMVEVSINNTGKSLSLETVHWTVNETGSIRSVTCGSNMCLTLTRNPFVTTIYFCSFFGR